MKHIYLILHWMATGIIAVAVYEFFGILWAELGVRQWLAHLIGIGIAYVAAEPYYDRYKQHGES